jgi:hypothetical protein
MGVYQHPAKDFILSEGRWGIVIKLVVELL